MKAHGLKVFRLVLPTFILSGLLLAGAGCGNDAPGLYITMWSNPFSSLQVGQEAKHSIQLSQVPASKVYVDVENSYPDLCFVDPMTVPFQETAKKEVTIKGLKAGKVTLVFKIRENGQTRSLGFTVVDQSPPGDGGVPTPDTTAPKPDTTAPKPDTTAPKPDTAAPSPG